MSHIQQPSYTDTHTYYSNLSGLPDERAGIAQKLRKLNGYWYMGHHRHGKHSTNQSVTEPSFSHVKKEVFSQENIFFFYPLPPKISPGFTDIRAINDLLILCFTQEKNHNEISHPIFSQFKPFIIPDEAK